MSRRISDVDHLFLLKCYGKRTSSVNLHTLRNWALKFDTLLGLASNVRPWRGANEWWTFGVFWYLTARLSENNKQYILYTYNKQENIYYKLKGRYFELRFILACLPKTTFSRSEHFDRKIKTFLNNCMAFDHGIGEVRFCYLHARVELLSSLRLNSVIHG